MKIPIIFVISSLIFTESIAGNNYIEFRQYEKVEAVSVTAGALYACSKNKAFEWPTRNAYQFTHFKLDQIVNDYFKISYRVIASQDIALENRIKIIDEHRNIEQKVNNLQEAGIEAINNKKMKCEDAGAFASMVWEFND